MAQINDAIDTYLEKHELLAESLQDGLKGPFENYWVSTVGPYAPKIRDIGSILQVAGDVFPNTDPLMGIRRFVPSQVYDILGLEGLFVYDISQQMRRHFANLEIGDHSWPAFSNISSVIPEAAVNTLWAIYRGAQENAQHRNNESALQPVAQMFMQMSDEYDVRDIAPFGYHVKIEDAQNVLGPQYGKVFAYAVTSAQFRLQEPGEVQLWD